MPPPWPVATVICIPAGVASFAGHINGSFPPGHIAQVARGARHLLNMLRAHGQAYAAIKAMPGGLGWAGLGWAGLGWGGGRGRREGVLGVAGAGAGWGGVSGKPRGCSGVANGGLGMFR